MFRQQDGWIGADGNYSITLSPERTLWFFSDTLHGQVREGKRENTVFLNNSIGVQTGRNDRKQVAYFWGTDASDPKPRAFFLPADQRGWLWPIGGALINGKVQLFLWQVEKREGSEAFGFAQTAVWRAEIENPCDSPLQWRVKQQKIPFTEISEKRRLLFGSAVLAHEKFLYVYGTEERPPEKSYGRKMVLARVEATAVQDEKKWRFWGDGAWQEDFRRVAPLLPEIATEYSVSWIPSRQRFLAVTHGPVLSPAILGSWSDQPAGPWSPSFQLYTCPETAWSRDFFCYAGKAHPALSDEGELLVTYAVNSFKFAHLFSDARIYWPVFVKVKLPPPASP